MKTFEEFIYNKEIIKIHRFSNSGVSDYGIELFLGGYSPKMRKMDKILFRKYVTDLTPSEKEEYNEFILQEYQKECNYVRKQYERDQKEKEFIEKHKDAILKIIPFSFTDHYDVYHLNCTDTEILEMSGDNQIKTIEEFDDLSQHDKLYLIIMIENGATTIETWEDYILD